jgi:hypothetical protein
VRDVDQAQVLRGIYRGKPPTIAQLVGDIWLGRAKVRPNKALQLTGSNVGGLMFLRSNIYTVCNPPLYSGGQ